MKRALAVLAFASTGAGWLDPFATAREAARLYAEGKFDEAATKYNQALVDDPDSALLHTNLGAAQYRQGKYAEAVAALGQIPASDADPARTARVAYDIGNAKYRLGATAETADPQKALGLYAEALVAYRRAMGVDGSDADAKFNHEFVEKKIAELTKKLEEEQKQQDQNEQEQQQEKQPQEKQPQGQEQEQPQPQADEKDQPREEAARQEQPADQQQKDVPQQREQGAAQAQEQQAEHGAGERPPQPTAGEAADGKMSEREAQALLDAERDQEVRPDEVVKRLEGAGVAEPMEDW